VPWLPCAAQLACHERGAEMTVQMLAVPALAEMPANVGLSAARCARQVGVFAPGMYELADYAIAWQPQPGSTAASGTCPGPPFLLTVDAA